MIYLRSFSQINLSEQECLGQEMAQLREPLTYQTTTDLSRLERSTILQGAKSQSHPQAERTAQTPEPYRSLLDLPFLGPSLLRPCEGAVFPHYSRE